MSVAEEVTGKRVTGLSVGEDSKVRLGSEERCGGSGYRDDIGDP